LPPAEDGFSGCIQSGSAVTAVIQLLPAAGDYIVIDGEQGTVATAIVSDGSLGDRICYIANGTQDWYVITKGNWAEE
jgi:hypothetical protein